MDAWTDLLLPIQQHRREQWILGDVTDIITQLEDFCSIFLGQEMKVTKSHWNETWIETNIGSLMILGCLYCLSMRVNWRGFWFANRPSGLGWSSRSVSTCDPKETLFRPPSWAFWLPQKNATVDTFDHSKSLFATAVPQLQDHSVQIQTMMGWGILW